MTAMAANGLVPRQQRHTWDLQKHNGAARHGSNPSNELVRVVIQGEVRANRSLAAGGSSKHDGHDRLCSDRDVVGVGHRDAEFGGAIVDRLKWCGDVEGGNVPAAASRVVVPLIPDCSWKCCVVGLGNRGHTDDGQGLEPRRGERQSLVGAL